MMTRLIDMIEGKLESVGERELVRVHLVKRASCDSP
jgi:hypothetical protein